MRSHETQKIKVLQCIIPLYFENIQGCAETLITDFELAPVNVFAGIFVNSDVAGCKFYLGQIIRRCIQKIGCVEKYKEGGEF
jgi:hypothetical protein